MNRVVAVTAQSFVIGVTFGVLARLMMRVIALIQGNDPEFTFGATAAIVSFFGLAALGGGWGALFVRHRWMGLLLAVLLTFPIALMGVGIGGSDLADAAGEVGTGTFVLILVGAVLIAACVVASPVFAWRRARRSAGVLADFTRERPR